MNSYDQSKSSYREYIGLNYTEIPFIYNIFRLIIVVIYTRTESGLGYQEYDTPRSDLFLPHSSFIYFHIYTYYTYVRWYVTL